jgi:hypothetical protein
LLRFPFPPVAAVRRARRLAPLLVLGLAAAARARGEGAAPAAKAAAEAPPLSPAQILPLIPAPAGTVAEAKRRRGRVSDAKGHSAEIDASGRPAMQALFARAYAAHSVMRSAKPAPSNALPPPIVELEPAEQAALAELGDGAHAVINESAAASREFEDAVQKERDALAARLRAGKDPAAARAAFLKAAAKVVAGFRPQVEAWIGRGDALVAAARAKIAPARFAARAQGAANQLGSEEDLLLWELIRANDAIVLAATDPAPPR